MEELKQYDKTNKAIDRLESVMADYPVVECPLDHIFGDNLYVRKIFMPAGTLVTSMVHLTNHPYFVMQGKVSVFSENDGEEIIDAPFFGMTRPNTRRVLYIHEDCVWITVHDRKAGETVDDIENRIMDARENDLLSDQTKKIFSQLHRYGLEVKELVN